MIYLTIIFVAGVLGIYLAWVKSAEVFIVKQGFVESDMPPSLTNGDWEILKQGTHRHKAYVGPDNIYAFVFKRDSGNPAIDIPCLAIFSPHCGFSEHFMALTDEMKTQYGTRFKSSANEKSGSNANVYYFSEINGIDKFVSIVEKHFKRFSVEVLNKGVLIVTARGNFKHAVESLRDFA